MQKTQFDGYLLLHNIAKPKNMGTIVRNAAAFKFRKVFLIGKNENKKKFKVLDGYNFFGNHGTLDQTEFQIFENLKTAKDYFVQNQIFVCGVEITDNSESVIKQPFKGNTVFFLGNEGSGLIEQHKAICDHFIYIPQYSNKTASLNVGVASGIIFHHFAIWAGYEEQSIIGEKFHDREEISQEVKKKRMMQIEEQKKNAVQKPSNQQEVLEDGLDQQQQL